MQCSKCGQEVPADAIYCPHCTGDRKTTDRDVIRGGIRGGAIGLFLGMLPAFSGASGNGQDYAMICLISIMLIRVGVGKR